MRVSKEMLKSPGWERCAKASSSQESSRSSAGATTQMERDDVSPEPLIFGPRNKGCVEESDLPVPP